MDTSHISKSVDTYYRDLMNAIQCTRHSNILPQESYDQCIILACQIGYLANYIKTCLNTCDNLTQKIEEYIPVPWRPVATLE